MRVSSVPSSSAMLAWTRTLGKLALIDGFFDDETCRLEPVANPFEVRNVSGLVRNRCVRNGPFMDGAPGRTRTCDPLLRRQMLYPAELRALTG
jgi:hypothetical protein